MEGLVSQEDGCSAADFRPDACSEEAQLERIHKDNVWCLPPLPIQGNFFFSSQLRFWTHTASILGEEDSCNSLGNE